MQMTTSAVRAAHPREFFPHFVTQDLAGNVRLLHAFGGNVRMQFGQQHPAGQRIVKSVQQLTSDAKRRRHDAARMARVHTFGQNFNGQRAADQTAQ